MRKTVVILICAVVLLALLLGAAWLLMSSDTDEKPAETTGDTLSIVSRTPADVASVSVKNSSGEYTVTQADGNVTVHDIPAKLVNADYVTMLLDEASSVEYISVVTTELSRKAEFGLAEPEAEVEISYTDGSQLRLLLGAEEPISSGRYFMTEGGDTIYIMKNSRAIRFVSPVEVFINFIIVPPEETTQPLSELQDFTISGTSVGEPIVLRAVLPDREEEQLKALSYGSITHLIVSPNEHEASPTTLSTIADQLFGLMSEEIVDYNCTEEELAAYGFDEPYIQYDFMYKRGSAETAEAYCLKVCKTDEGYIATLNDDGVVYRILDLDFLHVSYEELVMRWFISPFISEVSAIELSYEGGNDRFDIVSDTVSSVSVTREGEEIDSTLFRQFYNLVMSAASDSSRLVEEPELSEPVLTLRVCYKDGNKADDVLNFYDAGQRRLYVEVNGVCEFTMRENWLTVTLQALENVKMCKEFSSDW